jgi:outer membrane putative beta-barrel porin/alpha-amylase
MTQNHHIEYCAVICVTLSVLIFVRSNALATTSDDSAASAPADKSRFTLLNPTPGSELREFNSDRPDVTESPYTVDAGHFQAELSFVEYTHDSSPTLGTNSLAVLPANLKIGLLNNVDLQFVLSPFSRVDTQASGAAAEHHNEFGAIQVRTKINFWGNDGGVTAGGIMPFIQIPTNTNKEDNHYVEGGIILPLAISLPAGFDVGTMAEFDFDHSTAGSGYGVDLVHTITLGHALFAQKLNGYVEYAGITPIDTGNTYLAYLNTGVTYLLLENVQLDCGVNFGLSRHANDYTVFAGLSIRL